MAERAVKKWIKGAAAGLTDLLYPPRCPLCGDILTGRQTACSDCLKKEQPIREPRCKKCGKALRKEEQEYCEDCEKRKHLYTEGRGIFPYQGGMKKALLDLKYQGKRENALFLGRALANLGRKDVLRWRPEVVIPVPVHRKRRKERGYNQAELLARICAEAWGIPMDSQAVVRTHRTKAQKNLDPKERRKNLASAFGAGKSRKNYKNILIIDDIYTTGSTLDEVSRVLLKQGAEHIYFLTVCIGTGI